MWVAIVILLLIVIAGIAGVIIYGAKIYNDLVSRRNKVKNSWAHIDAQLQRRFDLVPNLVEIVRGYAAHEKQIFDEMTAAINGYVKAQTTQEKLAMDAQLSNHLQTLYAMVESYPQLKANANFLQLQEALTEIEEDISYARQFYNDAVTIYNNLRMQFPNNIIANKYGFEEETLFEAAKGAENAPKVYFKSQRQCPVCGAVSRDDAPNCKYCGCSLL